MTVESRKYLRDLRRLVDQHFSLEDLKLLCFDLEVDYDHLAGDGKLLKIESLCKHLARRDRLQDLLVLSREERSKVDWPQVPPPAQQAQDEAELQQSGGDRIGALQKYLDTMTENLEALRKSKVREPIHIRAHADTQLILETLDPIQKALVVQFLYESGLLNHQNATYLERSNLSGAVLEGMNLSNTPLTETDLSGARLKAANLTGAKLNKSRLSRADLTAADLTKAMFILPNRVGYLAACRDPLFPKAFDTAPLAARQFIQKQAVAYIGARVPSRQRFKRGQVNPGGGLGWIAAAARQRQQSG